MASLLSSSHGHSLEIVTESSCQFFIKRPITSYPCSFRRYAATLESTPPLNPTTTLFFFSMLKKLIFPSTYEFRRRIRSNLTKLKDLINASGIALPLPLRFHNSATCHLSFPAYTDLQ